MNTSGQLSYRTALAMPLVYLSGTVIRQLITQGEIQLTSDTVAALFCMLVASLLFRSEYQRLLNEAGTDSAND